MYIGSTNGGLRSWAEHAAPHVHVTLFNACPVSSRSVQDCNHPSTDRFCCDLQPAPQASERSESVATKMCGAPSASDVPHAGSAAQQSVTASTQRGCGKTAAKVRDLNCGKIYCIL